jgi:hypothetical protein
LKQAIGAGMNECLSKPMTDIVLQDTIARLSQSTLSNRLEQEEESKKKILASSQTTKMESNVKRRNENINQLITKVGEGKFVFEIWYFF